MTNVWDIGRTKGAEREQTGGHATCPQDGLVVDAFLGSGSTLIAAEQTNRKCYGIELDEKYCDVIVRRWTKYMLDNNEEFTVKRNGETLQQHQLDKYLN
jgi:adenine specific DNA methylase Mod